MSPSKLQKFLNKHGLTVVDWSARTHVSVRTIERYLDGTTANPLEVILDTFAREMGIIEAVAENKATRA